ncbi:MAG: hypothetical protein LBM70_06635 [Victivallales bacterium]|jgi:hypothetical protein|nr:hypothetical protein [Victivallales bacterium]
MRDLEDEPRFKAVLEQIAKVDIPDYPDWKRGWRWGITSAIVSVIIIALFFFTFAEWSNIGNYVRNYGLSVAVLIAIISLLLWTFGAFRPQKM